MVFFSSGSQCWYFSHEPSSLFHRSVLVDLSASMMLVNHYANRTLIVSCTKDYNLISGKGLRAVEDP